MADKAKNIDVKWYEKKQGISRHDKIVHEEKKEKRRLKREAENAAREKEAAKKSFENNKKFVQPKKNVDVYIKSSFFEGTVLDSYAKEILENFSGFVEQTHPLNSKQKALLPKQIKDFSHNLTDQRSDRRLGYMNSTLYLSAYVHYYLWWNLVRLTKLFSGMNDSFFELKDDSVCLDLGSGPLTVVLALYLARPELRSKKITWYCMDISNATTAFGEDIFYSVAAKCQEEPWKIVRVKAEFGEAIKEKVDFVTCANMLNELKHENGTTPEFLAKNYTSKILSYIDSKKDAKVLLIEPGVPPAARLLSEMRASFMRKNYFPVSPCPHCSDCPMDGKRGGKWCNFAFTTDDAPSKLKKLSQAAELPKERAVLSFVALKKGEITEAKGEKEENLEFIITSDRIRLPGNQGGYYACSKLGLLLIKTQDELLSGQTITVKMSKFLDKIDEKSGAIIINC